MWFTKRPTPTPAQQELDRLLDLLDSQARHIHRLETELARATNRPLPAPLRLPSRAPSPSLTTPGAPHKIRGAESVSVMDRTARQEEEHRQAVQTAFKLPAYMDHPSPIPEIQVPTGKNVGGGFSTPHNAPPPDKNPPPGSPSTGS